MGRRVARLLHAGCYYGLDVSARVAGRSMIEEPYRWVEAIANRREYIEHQLAPGIPIAALGYRGGVLLFTVSRERQKLF